MLAARGRLDAKLSTGGATASRSLEPRAAWSLAQPGASRSLEQKSSTLRTAVFIISYAPPSNGTLTPNWVTGAPFNSDCGGVAPEAATLR